MRGLSATHSSIQDTTLPAIFAPASCIFEALARQKLPGWQPATSCSDPHAGHSCPLTRTRTAEVYSIHPGNASLFLRKTKLFLSFFRVLVVCFFPYIQHIGYHPPPLPRPFLIGRLFLFCRKEKVVKKRGPNGPLYAWMIPYSMTLDMTPEATVRPPSRIANRRPSSMAMGVISLIVIVTWSPGMTISTPSGSWMEPVTSVVRK